MPTFRPDNRLPEDDLVFFRLDLIPQLDREDFYASSELETRGAPPFEPTLLVGLRRDAYSMGVDSRRTIAVACDRHLAFLAVVGADRPDVRTLRDFRKDHLHRLAKRVVQVLRLAAEAGLVRLGNLAFDGSKFTGQASRHKARSYGDLKEHEARWKEEIPTLLAQAEQTAAAEDAVHGRRRGDELPAELQRREDRLAVIQAARARREEHAKAEAEAEQRRRADQEAERQRAGKKRRGKEPKPVSEVSDAKAQCSFSDPERKRMPQSNKGWDYAPNTQISVDGAFPISVACAVTAAVNAKDQAVPLASATQENLRQAGGEGPKAANGAAEKIPATLDRGYYGEKAAAGMEAQGFDPHLATGRHKHNQGKPPPTTAALPEGASAKEKMQAKWQTPEGQKRYARRKVIVEPGFGQVKGARGFRRFSFRGLLKIGGEGALVGLTHNLLKLWRYRCAFAST